MNRMTLLGSTGSIGQHTLEVIRLHPQAYSIFALCAGVQSQKMAQQCLEFSPAYAVMATEKAASELKQYLNEAGHTATQVEYGLEAMSQKAAHVQVDMVMGAMVGALGLLPCIAAADAGKKILLANKEVLVLGGPFFIDAVRRGGATLLPVDSEHSAIFQCWPRGEPALNKTVQKVILTASGGPFRTRSPDTLSSVSPEEAIAHPNWSMGAKISIDSATMMNKVLEMVEAKWLFDLQPEQIGVWIHPQSIVHSFVEFTDHSYLAQLGCADMKIPIAYAMAWPDRIPSGASALSIDQIKNLSFEEPDVARYPCLTFALEVLKKPILAGILNAANEVAVAAFLKREIRFDQIYQVNASTLEVPCTMAVNTIDDLLLLDQWAREQAQVIISQTKGR